MAKSAIRRLETLQKKLYESAYSNASTTPLIDTPTIIKYAESFYESLPKDFDQTDINSINTDIDTSDYLLYGDFHTFKQTQKGLIRLLKAYKTHNPGRQIILAMEMFKNKDQSILDAYLANRISEDEFLSNYNYEHNWGFPWHNYKIILEYANLNQIKIVGISTDLRVKDNLKKRDEYAATVLKQLKQSNPKHLIVCLIGEYHLANKHLPNQLEKSAKYTRILSNIDHYYFNATFPLSSNTEYIKLKDNLYCVLNSPPWIKWQSYAIWEEMKSVEEDYLLEDQEYTEEVFDIDYQIFNILNHINDFLNLDFKQSDLTSFTTYLDPGKNELKSILSSHKASLKHIALINFQLNEMGYYYMPSKKLVFIRSVSLNNISEIAGQIIYTLIHPNKWKSDFEQDFYSKLIRVSSGFLISKIFNPRRKCEDLSHYEKICSDLKHKRLLGDKKRLRELANHIIQIFHNLHNMPGKLVPQSAIHYDQQYQHLLSLKLGNIIGCKTYLTIVNSKEDSLGFTQFFQFSRNISLTPTDQYTYLAHWLSQNEKPHKI